MSVLHQGYRSS